MPGHRVQALYAFLAIDPDDDEAVPAFHDAQTGYFMPLVGSDLVRVESLREMAQRIATRSGHRITLVKFTTREDVEVLEP